MFSSETRGQMGTTAKLMHCAQLPGEYTYGVGKKLMPKQAG